MDRNIIIIASVLMALPSLSARRAWIEIQNHLLRTIPRMSLSARRAWIEILGCRIYDMSAAVALRKESVDRNFHRTVNIQRPTGRSPQGERG